jgi:AraC family transcriptional regulator
MADEHAWPERRTAHAGSFLVEVFFTPPNTHAPFHIHDQVTVVVPLTGLFVENTLKKSIEGKPGVLIVETPESPHENIYSARGGTNLRLSMSPELQRFIDCEAHGDSGHIRSYEIARSMAENMRDPLLLECAGLEILGFLNNGPEWVRRRRPAFLREIVAELRANGDLGRGIAAIARDAHVSPIRLVRSFRSAYGISLARYIRVVQMQRALSLLSDPVISISTVAAEAGFSDQSHMTRAFAQTYGVTPGAFRRKSMSAVWSRLAFREHFVRAPKAALSRPE